MGSGAILDPPGDKSRLCSGLVRGLQHDPKVGPTSVVCVLTGVGPGEACLTSMALDVILLSLLSMRTSHL